jgi:hypothetical protein
VKLGVDATAKRGQRERMNKTLMDAVAGYTVEQLCEMAAKLSTDFRDEAGTVLDAVLATLMAKMPEADFVRFCDKL